MTNLNSSLYKDLSPEFNLLSSAADILKKELLHANEAWTESPFEWVLHLSPGAKGKFGKLLLLQWLALKSFSVNYTAENSEADILVNNFRVEVKFSTLWQNRTYAFQQIRDQDYDLLICFGLSPFDAHCWVLTKDIFLKHVIGHLGQHTGSKGAETSWIRVNPKNPPVWMKNQGGALDEAYQVLSNITKKR